MNPEIQQLISLTTIVKVFDYANHQLLYGDEYLISRFQANQNKQINLSDLEIFWENKWSSFNNAWGDVRQNYRFLYDSFKLLYFSFEQLELNKINSINSNSHDQTLHLNELCGVSLYGVYHHGKKCVDLLGKLGLITANQDFLNRFRETRNKLIEHNHNPLGMNIMIEPHIWSLSDTTSFMEVSIHNHTERAFDAYIDYYEDYYNLEIAITDIIKSF